MNNKLKKKKSKVNYQELFTTYKFLLIIPLLLLFFFSHRQPEGILPNLARQIKIPLTTSHLTIFRNNYWWEFSLPSLVTKDN